MTSRSVLAYRFSSLGDVALTVPVFKTLEKTDPDLHIYFATQPRFSGLFSTLKNVTVVEADIYGRHKGFIGIKKLYSDCVEHTFDTTIDLHNVFRSKCLSALFKLNRKVSYTYDKKRRKRRDLIKNKQLSTPLPHITELYLEAFRPLVKATEIYGGPWINPVIQLNEIRQIRDAGLLPKSGKWICIAPFSKHGSKQWPKVKSLLLELSKLDDVKLFCMAFGDWESLIAKEWKKSIPGMFLITEGFSLEEQLSTLASMDAVVSMDSANMHLATLVGTPVVSVWTATHPGMGFSPLSNSQYIVQPDVQDAPWRPLTVYGKLRSKTDKKRAKKAMDLISVEDVYAMTIKAARISC